MNSKLLLEKVEAYLHKLCLEIPTRRVGSEGNRSATDFFADTMTSFGFEVESPEFECIDWVQDGATLKLGDISFDVYVSPYSLSCQVGAPLAVISTLEELEAVDTAEKVILVKGELAKEQLMPKNFPFYNPDHHKRIIQLLETKKPQAIIAATSRDPAVAGAVYPFPLIEDGDFDIPSVYMTEETGYKLAEHEGKQLSLEIRASRIPAKACNVITRKGAHSNRRVVLFAHIDAKDGTPGAADNAAGVIVLLLLGELLADYSGDLGIEIVALNGEDYYSSPGEQQYLRINAGKFDDILLGINLDGVGYYRGKTAYSLYDCTSKLADLIHEAFSPHQDMVAGEPWYQGDHGLFLMNQTPALAITSEKFIELLMEIAHTPKDNPGIVDPNKLIYAALALRDLMLKLDRI
ncbi:MAG: M28 family peptidase [Anaerolineales bacterium]